MRSALVVFLALMATGPALAGSWAVGDGAYYTKLGVSHLATRELATPDGNVVGIPEFERQLVSLYLEYGVGSRWTAIVDAPLRSESSIEGFGSAYGPGDLTVGLQRQLRAPGPWAFAARALVQAPTGDEMLGDGLLPAGSGAWEAEVILSAGRSLSGGRGWGYLEVGRRARGEGLADALTYRGQAGRHLGTKATAAWNVHGIEPDANRPGDGAGPAAGLGNGVRYLAFGPEVAFEVASGWRIELAAEDTTQARNLATGLTVRIGLSRSR